MATALYHFLKRSDDKKIKQIYLFADGCSGQNKNSIIASTLLYVINNATNIEDIFLQFSVPCHGQSEGDSAHSAIGYALKKSGDIFIPAQLVLFFSVATLLAEWSWSSSSIGGTLYYPSPLLSNCCPSGTLD